MLNNQYYIFRKGAFALSTFYCSVSSNIICWQANGNKVENYLSIGSTALINPNYLYRNKVAKIKSVPLN